MKAYTVAMSLVGAALAAGGGLAYLLATDSAVLPLVNLGLGAALVVAAGVLNPELFRHYSRWINAFWGTIMVLGIVVMLNFLADRYHKRLDLTAGKLHSLSDLTVQTLEGLPGPVKALAFMEEGKNEALESLLKEFTVHGEEFAFEFVDPDRDPERTQDYGVRAYNTLVLEMGERRQSLTELTEKEIASALLKLLEDRQQKVYLSVGHGEAGGGDGERDLGRLVERLEEFDYQVADTLFIARSGQVPEDCDVLVIAGPQTAFFANEIEAVRRYLSEGGALLLLADPAADAGFGELLARWRLELGDDFVIDTSGIGSLFGLDYTSPVAVNYGEHPVTRKHQGYMTFYELARSVRYAGDADGFSGAELVLTSDQGWAETDLSVLSAKGARTVEMDEGVDRAGPVALAAAVQHADGGRLVVFGDADFASNRYFDLQGNGDLALNALSWLAEDESLISIRPRQAGYNPIALTESQSDLIFWITVVIYPFSIALVGILVVARKGSWSLRQMAAAGLGVVLSLGVVVLVNYLSDSYHYRIDTTQGKLFTLADDTKRLLKRLESEDRYVQAKVFMNEAEGFRYQDILKEYRYHTDRFDYEVIDPQKKALEIRQYNIRQRGTTVLEVSGGGKLRSERFSEQGEESLSNAIQRALNADENKVYFTGGHGEGELTDPEVEGYSILNGRLKELNFQIADHLDLKTDEVPADATVLAVLGPQSPFAPTEAAKVQAFLERGGAGLFFLDPGAPTGLEEVLDEFSIEVGQDFVVDISGIGQLLGADVSVPIVIEYGEHPVTENLGRGTMSFFPLARSVAAAAHRRRNPEITELALTDPRSWGETDLNAISGGDGAQVQYDAGVDRRGPLSLAVAVVADADTVSGSDTKTRLLVFGDSDFASNQYFGQQANGQFLASGLAWLVEGDDRLVIPAREAAHNPINLVGNQGTVVLWVSVFILPFAVALSGLVIGLRRGYRADAPGFIAWLMYTFIATAVFYFVQAVIGKSEGSWARGEGYMLLALAGAAVAYGLFRRDGRAWAPALVLAVLNAGIGFVAIPNDVLQLAYAAVAVVNAAILVWIRKVFEREE